VITLNFCILIKVDDLLSTEEKASGPQLFIPILFSCQLFRPKCQPDDDKYHYGYDELIGHHCPQSDITNFLPDNAFIPEAKHSCRLSGDNHQISKPLNQQNTIGD
jgi:hypothetical protein